MLLFFALVLAAIFDVVFTLAYFDAVDAAAEALAAQGFFVLLELTQV